MHIIWVLVVVAYSAYGGRYTSFQEFNGLQACERAQAAVYEGSVKLGPSDNTIFAKCVAKD